MMKNAFSDLLTGGSARSVLFLSTALKTSRCQEKTFLLSFQKAGNSTIFHGNQCLATKQRHRYFVDQIHKVIPRKIPLSENWSGRRDSNPRPQPWQGCALPLSYAREPYEHEHKPSICGAHTSHIVTHKQALFYSPQQIV